MRVGFGYDAHAFAPDRKLVIGGIVLEGPGLAGHSDADVLCHAVADALLGAAGLGDLGAHFPADRVAPDTSSLSLLTEVAQKLKDAGYRVANIDATVVIQQVRISPRSKMMAERIASALGLVTEQVNVKSTTTDGLGFSGRSEGAEAYAVALLLEA